MASTSLRSKARICSRSSALNGQPCMTRLRIASLRLLPMLNRDRSRPARRAALCPPARASVDEAAKLGGKIEDVGRQRPAQAQMAGKLGVGDEADEQDIDIDTVRRKRAELVAPQPKGLPGPQLARSQADHIGCFARLRDELEVRSPDLCESIQRTVIQSFSQGHLMPLPRCAVVGERLVVEHHCSAYSFSFRRPVVVTEAHAIPSVSATAFRTSSSDMSMVDLLLLRGNPPRRVLLVNGSSSTVTGCPLLKQRVFRAFDDRPLSRKLTGRFCLLQLRPDRVGKPADRCRKNLLRTVFQVCVQAHPPAMPSTSPISLVRAYSFCSISPWHAVGTIFTAPML